MPALILLTCCLKHIIRVSYTEPVKPMVGCKTVNATVLQRRHVDTFMLTAAVALDRKQRTAAIYRNNNNNNNKKKKKKKKKKKTTMR